MGVAGLAHELVAASLTAFQTLPVWLRAAMNGEHVGACLRRRHEHELAEQRLTLVSCRADHLRAVGEQWQGRYELTVRDSDGGLRDLVLAGRLWHPANRPAVTNGARSVDRRFGEHGWETWLPEVGLELRVQSVDEALPALATLVTPDLATRVVDTALRTSGHRGARALSCAPRVARYQPGVRCTVVVDITYADPHLAHLRAHGQPPPNPLVLKTQRGDKGAKAWDVMNALWQRSPAWRDVVTLAEPLAYLTGERILVQGPVPQECTLKELAGAALAAQSPDLLARLREELAGTARALAAVHWCGVAYPSSTTLDESLAEVRAQSEQLARSVPKVRAASEPLLRLVDELAHRASPDPLVAAHNDFNPGQVLLDNGAIGLIDFDKACIAEPAMDVGRFRAKLRDIGVHTLARSGRPVAGEELDVMLRLTDDLCDHFLAAYQEYGPISTARLSAWETYYQFTLLLHAWTRALDHRVAPRLAVLLHQLACSTA